MPPLARSVKLKIISELKVNKTPDIHSSYFYNHVHIIMVATLGGGGGGGGGAL